MKKKNKISWPRLLWVIFIYLYAGLFFYNFFRPFQNWLGAYIYTMILVLWLGKEYYEKRLFFQSGFLPPELYPWYLRAGFALFFYSAFIIGCATTVWWPENSIHLYPITSIIGIISLVYAVYVRWQSFNIAMPDKKTIGQFYASLYLLTFSLTMGYSSLFLLPYVVLIGFPLVLVQKINEMKSYDRFEVFMSKQAKSNKLDKKTYADLWQKYLDKYIQKRGKR